MDVGLINKLAEMDALLASLKARIELLERLVLKGKKRG